MRVISLFSSSLVRHLWGRPSIQLSTAWVVSHILPHTSDFGLLAWLIMVRNHAKLQIGLFMILSHLTSWADLK